MFTVSVVGVAVVILDSVFESVFGGNIVVFSGFVVSGGGFVSGSGLVCWGGSGFVSRGGSGFVSRGWGGLISGCGSRFVGRSRCGSISRCGFVDHRGVGVCSWVGVGVGVSRDVIGHSHSGEKGEGKDLEGV